MLTEAFGGVDAMLMPTAPGPAPKGHGTGDAVLLRPWSLLGFPAITIPGGLSPDGLPLGLQLVAGPRAAGLSRARCDDPDDRGEPRRAADRHAAWQQPTVRIHEVVAVGAAIEAGVLDGDTAVVERSESARNGDFVIASIDGKYTIKELRFERRIPVLVPHNKDYETIRPREDFLILGVVRAIVRRYDKRGRSTKIGGARS